MAQKVRVFKLAKDFGEDNDTMVAKIQNLGFAVRNYMSALDVEDAQRIVRLLEKERAQNTVEEQIRPTVVRRRTKKGAPPKVKPPKVEAAAAEPVVEEATPPAPVEEAAPAVPAAPQDLPVREEVASPAAMEPVPQEETPAPAPEAIEPEPEREPDPAPTPASKPVVEKEQVPAEQLTPDAFFQNAFKDMEAQAMGDQSAQEDDAAKPASLRPASEAPIIKRRIQVEENGTTARKSKASPRRRQVESREISPSRRFPASAPAKFGTPPGRKRRMTPGKKGKKTEITTPKAIKRVIRMEGQITLQDLAKRMSVKATELLMKLIGLGMAGININSTLDPETAKIVAEEFGYDVEDVAVAEEDLLTHTRAEETEEEKAQRETRAPIVTMMGHVDHGKTSLLDAIRNADVVSGEAGGITQHIGAYRAKTPNGEIAFIDTPGHAAFTAMRARGAHVTDIVILVCAADDGVMPQTIEAIDHARAAECPMIVAINKCDLPGADPDRTRRTLMEHNVIPEDLGGDTIMVEVSAKTGQGLDKLMEMVLLQAEMMELNANPNRPGAGVVLEAYLDKGRGPVANILVKEGTLRIGEILVAGSAYGKIRAMTDEHGRKASEAGPSTPVEILGLNSVPGAGDTFDAVPDMKLAEKVAQSRADKTKASTAAPMRPSLEAFYQQMQNADQADLKLILKSDVQGTMEALRDSLTKLSGDKVKITIASASVGGITESDVLLASTAGAIIIGFNVRPAGKARKLAEEQGVDIKIFSIIYEVIDAVKAAMLGLLSPTVEEEAIGMAEVRDTFTIPKIGTVAGSYVTDGKIQRNCRARLIRDSIQIWEGKVGSLRRFKDDVKEVQSGFECGITLDGYNDVKVGDVVEFYVEKEVEATL